MLLALLVADVMVGLEPTPTDPLTLVSGGTLIVVVAGLASLLVRASTKRGDGWGELMEAQRKAVADEGARADRAEARVAERDAEVSRLRAELNQVHRDHRQTEAAARYAVDAQERAEQALADCQAELQRRNGGQSRG